ncbi:trypsin-like peptidase domain-containing protein [Nodosilinea sp. FACHB-131]|uniref:VMAP-C domain-containing protein n=1 Tax=Cyanophyceae TaxID=3028117 RepID=UPI00168362B5|nr:trypsin-like peptidase domain-containing protein [Nodosilinea sp. FACHB-131]MBD1877180.1 trypsin-like peptidase domain-containing protein [Nodosilinea sp. FACHB-131]
MADSSVKPNTPGKTAIARIYKGNTVVGAGFWVEGGYLLTCAHVIRDALALQSEESALGRTVRINFPFVSLSQKLTAKVLLYRYDKGEDTPDEDIAGLRVLESLPEGVCPARVVSSYEFRNPYQVLGFPKGHGKGIGSYGQLLEELPNGLVQMEDTKAEGVAILPGFSGTPVWDEGSGSVVGMVVAREKDQPQAKIGFMVPGRQLLAVRRELESLGLLALLTDASDAFADAIKLAYRLCCPQGWEMPESLVGKLASLQDVKRGDRPFEAIAQFVGLLSLPDLTLDADLRESLRNWVQQRVEDAQPLLDEAQRLLDQHQVAQANDAPSHLLIYVKDESTDARSVSALFVRDASQYTISTGMGGEPVQAPGQDPFHEKVTLATLPALVQACLDEVLDKAPQRLMLHLILPMAWLHQDCDRWPLMDCSSNEVLALLDEIRIGERFCCAVRITERLNPDILKRFREPWQDKWKQLESLRSSDLCTAFVPGDGVAPGPLRAKLNSPNTVGLKLSTVYDESQYPKLFATLIATGTPAALWLRSDQFAATVAAATDLDGLLNCKISTLPEAIKQCRSAALAMAEDAHIGHHLSFLLDDPNLVPPSTHLSLAMPQP